jgi:polyisoprenyl-phosphate glycosyltransferase
MSNVDYEPGILNKVALTHSTFIVTPCYNENIAVIKFLTELDKILSEVDSSFTVIVVDDASIDNTLQLLKKFSFNSANIDFKVISLRYNLGHQGAIYQGLLYARSLDASNVIVMDSDGEDDPNAILQLIKLQDSNIDIVHVVRAKRKERLLFRAFYKFYKIIFRFITKKTMNFGNYCMINQKIIETTTETSFIHFAGYLSKQKAKSSKIVYNRRSRLDGKSKMNLDSLVHHAFKSFIEYAEDLLMLFLKLFILLAAAIIILIGYILYEKIFTNNAILGWASTLSATLFNTAIISLGFFVLGILLLNMMSKNDIKFREKIYKTIDV